MTYGSLRHDFNGRKRKRKKVKGPVYAKRPSMDTVPLGRVEKHPSEDRPTYPSSDGFGTAESCTVTPVRQSAGHTVAIAYNKGGYQVIPNSEVEHIGK